MSGLSSLLPKPKHEILDRKKLEDEESNSKKDTDTNISTNSSSTSLSTLVVEDKKSSVIARIGHGEDRIIQTELFDTKPKYLSDEVLQRPTSEQIEEETEATRRALQSLIEQKASKTRPKSVNLASKDSQIIKYTPDGTQGQHSETSTRIIKMVQMQVDPLQPPKFHHKRVPRPPPSPPAPRLHSPPRKTTAEEQKAWYIPPCISSWKNPKGYTVPLDKRLAADGKALQEKSINNRMSDLAEALFLAEKHNREEVEMRAAVERKVAEQEKRKKDEQLRQLAEKAREDARRLAEDLERAARKEEHLLRRGSTGKDGYEDTGLGLTIRERERMRKEHAYEREREMRLSRMSLEQRAKLLERDSDRDISEKIALGVVNSTTGKESLFDQRLFDQSQGVSAGHGGGEDDIYNLYDKPLFSSSAIHMIYRPQIGGDEETYDEGAAASSEKGVGKPGKGFSGTEGLKMSEGPIQFEKKHVDSVMKKPVDDPFGVDQFLSDARKGKRANDSNINNIPNGQSKHSKNS